MAFQILIIEDQEDIQSIVEKYCIREGYGVKAVNNGIDGLQIFNTEEFHLIILDIMMPGINGYQVLKEIRQISSIPVIMLTAKEEEIDRIKGFELGADDYVVKPFSPRELMFRVKNLLEKVYKDIVDEDIAYKDKELSVNKRYIYKNLTLDIHSMKLYKEEKQVEITTLEYHLLKVLFDNKGQVLSRDQIIDLAYGSNYEGYNRNIDSAIKRLRKKIEDDPKHPQILVTKYGAGYIFGGR